MQQFRSAVEKYHEVKQDIIYSTPPMTFQLKIFYLIHNNSNSKQQRSSKNVSAYKPIFITYLRVF